jgi:hypothetical protein
MKNLVIAALLFLTSAPFASANCHNGVCSTRRPVVTALSTTKNILVSPFKRVRNNRVARQAVNSH